MQYNRKAFSEDYTTETFYFPLSVQVEDEDSEDLYNVSSDSVRWFEDEIQETILENKTLTLQYIFSEFLQGPMGRPQTGLKGYIMRLILDELAPDSKIDLDADGQEYFSAWKEKAETLQQKNGSEWMEKNRPEMYLLLQMMEK